KYLRIRQTLKRHPSVTVRGAVRRRKCSFNSHQHSLQQRFLHDRRCERGVCRLKSLRDYQRATFSQHPQAGHEVNRVCESLCTDLFYQFRLRTHRLIGWFLIGFNFPATLAVELNSILPVGAKKFEVDTTLRPEEGDASENTRSKLRVACLFNSTLVSPQSHASMGLPG